MLIIAFILLVFAVILFILAGQRERAAGLPGGRIVYADTSQWMRMEKPLYDPTVGLTGKPDYLVEHDGESIPVEVKSSRTDVPYDSHVFQLAAYCLLSHNTTGHRPSYGLIHYPERTFSIDYTPELEEALLDVVLEMQSCSGRRLLPRSHDEPQRCRRCGYQAVCDQKLN